MYYFIAHFTCHIAEIGTADLLTQIRIIFLPRNAIATHLNAVAGVDYSWQLVFTVSS